MNTNFLCADIFRQETTLNQKIQLPEEITNMLNSLFQSIYDGSSTSITVPQFLLCIAVSLLIGLFFAFLYSYKSRSSQNFVVTLALLPAIVCVIIMMVNGNVGAGVAVAGAFSLVRFRSVPGTSKEIGMLFLAMGAGLITGMGYLGYGVLFAAVLGLAMFVFTQAGLGIKKGPALEKTLTITIPESLNYSEVFDDLMAKYTSQSEVVSVKTTNMGSLFKLTYHINLKDISTEKEFIDELRCRNGNLEISISRQEVNYNEL
jgi:hypothetical protein